MDRASLTFRTYLNSAYNLIGYAWPILLTFFVTPLVVFRLGIKEYGIFIFINTISVFINIIDLGIGSAITKHLATYIGEDNKKGQVNLIRTANLLFFIIAVVGLVIFLIISFAGSKFLPNLFTEYRQYALLFAIAGFTFFVESASRCYTVTLNVLQRYDILTKINMSIFTLSSLGTLLIVYMNGGLYGVFIFQFFIALITAIVMLIKAKKHLPLMTVLFSWNTYEIKKSYLFGLANTINGLSGLALLHLDRLIIPFYVGPSNLTYYNMPGSIASKIPGLSSGIATMIFPLASTYSTEEHRERLKKLYVRSFRIITIASAAITVSCISFAHPLLLYWLNEDFAKKSTTTLIILALTNFALTLSGLMSNFLLGMGKLKILSITSFLNTLLNVLLLLFLLPRYGINGAAWAYLLSLVPLTYLFYYTEKHYLELQKRRTYYLKLILGTFIVSAILLVFNLVIITPFISSLLSVLIAAGTSSIIYVILYRKFGFFEDEDWNDFEFIYRKILKK